MNKKKYLYIIFIISILFKINISVSADCVHSGYRCETNDNFIVYTEPSNLGDGIYEFAEQYSGNRVFCIKKGATTPAIGVTNSNTVYCNSNFSAAKKWRAAVGYAINRYNNNILNYKTTQKIIHRVSYLAGSGEDCTKCSGKNLDRAVNIYQNYGSESLSLDTTTLTFTLVGNNYESNKISVEKLEYFKAVSSSLKINGTASSSDYIKTNSSGKIYVQIPKNIITSTSTVDLTLSSSYTYKLAKFNSCGGSLQPIARITGITDDKKTVTATASGSIVVNPTYTFNYTGNGGSGSVPSQIVEYGGQLTVANNGFTKPGYRFTGWAVRNDDMYKWYCSGWNPYADCEKDWSFNIYHEGHQYNINSSWNVKNDNSDHNFTFYAQWQEEKGTLLIKKVNSSGVNIINKDVSFKIYKGTGCKTESSLSPFIFNTGGDGKESITLPTGVYSIKEDQSPYGYIATGECIEVGNIESDKTTTIEVINKTACENDFDSNSSIANRIELYKNNYSTYNNLLNFTINKASEACSNTKYNLTSSDTCLSSSKKLLGKEFNNNDLSAYNDQLFYNNKTHYCLTEFELCGGLDDLVTSGQFVSTASPISTGILKKTCYIHKNDITTAPSTITINENLSDYIGSAKLDGKYLLNNFSSGTINYQKKGLIGEFYKYEASYNIEYYPWDVYAVIGSGVVRYNDCASCKYLGKGVISKFTPETKTVELDFVIEKPIKNVLEFGKNTKCSYRSVPEITLEDNLQLEFRVVDTNIPFERDTKSNWCSHNCDANNQVVVDNIINAPNSSGINSEGKKQDPIYTISLTADDIKALREYNNKNPYDNYEFYCTKKPCHNSFVEGLKKGILIGTSNSISELHVSESHHAD